MTLSIGIELPCFYYSEEDLKLKDLGLLDENNMDTAKKDVLTFYTIDAVSRDIDERFSIIYSGGHSFICALSYDEVKKTIKNTTSLLF